MEPEGQEIQNSCGRKAGGSLEPWPVSLSNEGLERVVLAKEELHSWPSAGSTFLAFSYASLNSTRRQM